MATAEQRFEADKKFAYRVLQDARQYATDFDRDGSKAEALYVRLDKARRLMQPWSTDGTDAQAKKAIEYLREIRSILSDKIGPASRREFSEQGGARHHATVSDRPIRLQDGTVKFAVNTEYSTVAHHVVLPADEMVEVGWV